MTTATAPSPTTTSVGEDLNHLYCCDPDLALCGLDVSALPEVDDDTDCVVCLDLEDADCDCGEGEAARPPHVVLRPGDRSGPQTRI